MIDYKEMIERLKYYGTTYAIWDNLGREINGSDDLMLTAAGAIETLLEERNAAVEMLRGECHACKHNAGWHNIGKCGVCVHETARDSFIPEKRTDCWEWRGPQKEDKHEAD